MIWYIFDVSESYYGYYGFRQGDTHPFKNMTFKKEVNTDLTDPKEIVEKYVKADTWSNQRVVLIPADQLHKFEVEVSTHYTVDNIKAL